MSKAIATTTAVQHSATSRQQHLAAADWLLSTARDSAAAREEWTERLLTFLPCGTLFSAVRMDSSLVHAATSLSGAEDVDSHLRNILHGPVFIDRYQERYYALVPASTTRIWGLRRYSGATLLGPGTYVGVPAITCTAPLTGFSSYWCVSVNPPGNLCDPMNVIRLVLDGQSQLADQIQRASALIRSSCEER